MEIVYLHVQDRFSLILFESNNEGRSVVSTNLPTHDGSNTCSFKYPSWEMAYEIK
jgi:hypothetical protein